MSKLKYDFYEDGGHGWLKVSLDELIKLGIHDKVSNCSYFRKDKVYLEEDCDATLFFDAKEKIGEKIETKTHISDKSSKIRNYDDFDYFQLIADREWKKFEVKIDNADNDQIKEILNEYNYTVELKSRVLFREEDI